jgi:hypothetical protein
VPTTAPKPESDPKSDPKSDAAPAPEPGADPLRDAGTPAPSTLETASSGAETLAGSARVSFTVCAAVYAVVALLV